MPTPRLLLINPNTTATVTERLVTHLAPMVPEGFELQARTASFGAPYIDSEVSHAVAAHAVVQAWQGASEEGAEPIAGVLIGCFGDPGLFALREACACPVTGLAEAAFIEAAQIGDFAIVTGGVRWGPMLTRLAHNLGYGAALRHIETVAPSGAALLADPALAQDHLRRACEAAARSGAKAIIIGGAGLAGWADRLQPQCPLPLIDSVQAGLRVLLHQCSALVRARPVSGQSTASTEREAPSQGGSLTRGNS
jgi:Asp/Glu/hydantoin racemase